jgi:hypothetical protein
LRDPEMVSVSSRFGPQKDRARSELCFSKVGFLAFIAMVINCTAEMECKSQEIDFVVAAAEKYLGLGDLTYRVC